MNVNTDKIKNIKEYIEEVSRKKVVRLRFRIQDESTGKLLQYGDDLFYLHGGYGGAFPNVERAMEGCRVGDRVEVALAPDEGYGHHQPGLVLELPSAEFADGDEIVPAYSQDMNNVPALHGRVKVLFTRAGHSLNPQDGTLLAGILAQ